MDECGFRAEYAKSDRSTCKGCRSTIDKDSLRLAIMVQSPNFDGQIPTWYHMNCFFKKVKPADAHIIKGFEDLRWDDQEKIRKKVDGTSTNEKNDNSNPTGDSSSDFSAEYARSNRSTCRGCDAKIEKDLVRLSKKVPSSHGYAPIDEWYHIDCFKELKDELLFTGTAETFSGFNGLNKEDQAELKKKLGSSTVSNSRKRKGDKISNATNGDAPKAKQSKTEENNDLPTEQDETRLKKEQSELLWKFKDALRKEVPNDVLKELLEHNQQKIATGESHLIDTVADCMAFGILEHCPECGGFLIFNYTCYRCTGDVTEWTKCSYTTQTPTRKAFDIPSDIKTEYEAFKSYKYKKRDRILAKVIENQVTIEKTPDVSRVIQEPTYDSNLPLTGYALSSAGRLSMSVANIQKEVERLGGTFSSKIDETVGIVISSPDEVQKLSKKIQDAQTLNIHIVSEEFLTEIKNDRPTIIMEKCKISTWGILPHIRQQSKEDKMKSDRKSITTASAKSDPRSNKSVPDKMKLKLKDGAAVDPESELEETCHVLKDTENGGIFSAVLGLVDITRGTNSYYKLQLLESDNGRQWFVFRAWGRTGTVIGNKKIDEYTKRTDAIKGFQFLFLDKTGNEWNDRENFQKLPNKHYPLEIDYGQHADNDKMQQLLESANLNVKSKLETPVQDLVKLIFNVETMKQALLSFEIDLTKMPLGKLSRNQLDKAYKVLTELQTLITSGATTTKTAFIDASNRFYTLIPHDFGLAKPVLLDNIELIKTKTEMIDNLLEIEIAYSMLDDSNNTVESSEHPIDVHYKKLKCDLISVDHNSEEFHRIEQYMIKTHAKTHDQYKLKLCELFKTTRDGELDRFKKFQTLDNHQLLWHGSRTTNFAGILSQGLRIAPPEAPVTGYMFGKGVYFADMVSKSANYCFTSKQSPEGLMLLCEVALGKMHECNQATTLSASTLPHGTHSTKGCGSTMPDPKEYYYTNDGLLIPMGHGIPATGRHTSLLYNEYIVYNTDQIKMKYLLRVDFQYKY